jgi:hypothetical protein
MPERQRRRWWRIVLLGSRLSPEYFSEFTRGRMKMGPSHGGNGQLDDGKPRLSEDDMTRALLGPRGIPGKPDTARMTPQQEKNMPKYVDPGHTE